MKSTIWKSTFREIKQSLGRFLAILAIVALGVGFLAGLKATQPAMLITTESYYRRTNFYDYRLLSTVGFGKDDVEVFAAQDDVKAAEGALQFDVLCEGSGGNTYVLKAHSITERINQLTVVKGRLPESANECAVDANLFDESWVGKKIKLSDTNEEEDLEHFSYREYTVTAIVQSPCYIQYERGSTSLGNGTVNGFVYLLPEGFAEDYYTEIYIAFDHNFPLYSDEYGNYMDERQNFWEQIGQSVAEQRYETVKEDASVQLADGKAELQEKRSEAEEELKEAEEELKEAEKQLTDGEKRLADAKEELDAAPDELARQEAELDAAERTLAEKEAELNAGEIALGIGFAQGIGQISDAMSGAGQGMFGSTSDQSQGVGADAAGAFGSAKEQMDSAKQQIADGRVQLAQAKEQIANGRAQLAEAKKRISEGRKEIAEKEEELADARKEYEAGRQEYEEGLEEYRTQIAEAEQKIADGEKALAGLKEPEFYALGRDTNIGYVCFENDSAIVSGMADVFPVFFFLVAALVCATTMNRMVEEQRTQIGVLKALGFSEWTIMFKYIFYSGIAAVLGCVLGFASGTVVFPNVIWVTYGIMYRIGSLKYYFDGRVAVISLIAALVCSVGTTLLSCRYELLQVAAELMRPKAPKVGKRVILEYIPFLWKRLKFLQKVSVRNVLRYKKRFFMMIGGISGCTALLVTGFGLRDSIANVAVQQYTEIQIYDINVSYSRPVDAAAEEELATLTENGVEEYAFVLEKTVDLETEQGIKSLNLVVLDSDTDMSPYLNLHTAGGEAISYPGQGEAVITHKFAEEQGIKVGSQITVRDENMDQIQVTVSGICQNFIYNYIYIADETYKDQMGEEPEYKTAYVNIAEDADARLAAVGLMKLEDVAAVAANADTMERVSAMMRSMDLIVFVVILCAAGLAFIVLYNLTNINITERIREIATVKVLGFYENESASYVFRENQVLSLIGAMVGLVLGYFLHLYVMSQINVDLIAFDIHVMPVSYLYSVLLTLVFSWLIGRAMRGKIDRISMTESLKSVD